MLIIKNIKGADIVIMTKEVLNSLNDNIGNRGVFQEGQFTPGGETPSEDLALYKISPVSKNRKVDSASA